jgi:hypothetical protein
MKHKSKRPRDPNQLAHAIIGIATGEITDIDSAESDKNPHAVELGRLGGKKGGRARAENLSPQQRKDIARKAAAARWKK